MDNSTNLDPILVDFCQAMRDCRELYVQSGRFCVRQHAIVLDRPAGEFIEMMDDLHRGLVVKTYSSVSLVDHKWARKERKLAQVLCEHAWLQTLTPEELRAAMMRLSAEADTISWYSLLRPFAEITPLRERVADLESIVMRMAIIVAKADGDVSPSEEAMVNTIREELRRHLRPISVDGQPGPQSSHTTRSTPAPAPSSTRSGTATTVQTIETEVIEIKSRCALPEQHPSVEPEQNPEERLAELMRELGSLVGLGTVKEEIRTLANFLKLQQHRRARNLPETNLSLHMVFQGNPGTGKTTVARLVAQIFQAMGILEQGHLVETDRSGLVAEYAGQTGPKTNERIDDAIDGVLFIDEAYSLVSTAGEDAYGREALQALIKRMEDDRDRLVVVLAGYPQPMDQLIRANPGLSSRFHRKLHFEDYTPIELCEIFERFCQVNHYELPADVRGRMLLGVQHLFDNRDEHFGNGRLMRNVFEDGIRHLANRVSTQATITHELLTRFTSADIRLPGVSSVDDEQLEQTLFSLICPGCQRPRRTKYQTLGRRVKCNACQHEFRANWADPLWR